MTLKGDRLLVLATLGVAIVLLLWGAWHLYSTRSLRISFDLGDQPMLGNPHAPVEMVVFEEMKCTGCQEYQTEVFPEIRAKYIDTGKVKYTTIVVSFLDNSLPANLAALSLYAQNREFFFPFISYVYEHQPSENEDWATLDSVCEFASHIPGVDLNLLRTSIEEKRCLDLLDKNFAIGEKAMGEEFATPAVFVDGRRVYMLSKNAISKKIEAALEQ